jgi:hypothetical protein
MKKTFVTFICVCSFLPVFAHGGVEFAVHGGLLSAGFQFDPSAAGGLSARIGILGDFHLEGDFFYHPNHKRLNYLENGDGFYNPYGQNFESPYQIDLEEKHPWSFNMTLLYTIALIQSRLSADLALGGGYMYNVVTSISLHSSRSDSELFFVLSLGTGLRYFIKENSGLRVDYRYLNLSIGADDDGRQSDHYFHRLTIGYFMRF